MYIVYKSHCVNRDILMRLCLVEEGLWANTFFYKKIFYCAKTSKKLVMDSENTIRSFCEIINYINNSYLFFFSNKGL